MTVSDPVYRLQLALVDLERATHERNLPVARYLLDTEISEALSAIIGAELAEPELLSELVDAVIAVQYELGRNPR
jgi:hypothetical protein